MANLMFNGNKVHGAMLDGQVLVHQNNFFELGSPLNDDMKNPLGNCYALTLQFQLISF